MQENFISYFSPELVDEIIEKCSELVASCPNEPRYYRDLGNAYLKKGSYADAADAFQRGLNVMPNDGGMLISLGQVLILLQDFDRAENTFRTALSLKPDWPDTHFWMGKVLFEQDKIREAMGYLQTAIEKNPRYLDAIYLSALIHEKEKDLTTAVHELKKVIALQPPRKGSNPFPFDLEVLFNDAPLLEETIRQLKTFLQNAEGFADLHFKLGMAFRKKGMKAEALAEFRKALHKNPNYHLARHYYWHWDQEPEKIVK
jgi:tetratricopeptide (TPR) repeat protein